MVCIYLCISCGCWLTAVPKTYTARHRHQRCVSAFAWNTEPNNIYLTHAHHSMHFSLLLSSMSRYSNRNGAETFCSISYCTNAKAHRRIWKRCLGKTDDIVCPGTIRIYHAMPLWPLGLKAQRCVYICCCTFDLDVAHIVSVFIFVLWLNCLCSAVTELAEQARERKTETNLKLHLYIFVLFYYFTTTFLFTRVLAFGNF